VRINGTLSADGEAGSTDNGDYAGGGGSGGSIWIQAYIIEGSGTLSANGGYGGDGTGADGGGGAGGRIALIHHGDAGSLTYDTSGATVNGGIGPGDATDGEVGTLAWSKDAAGSWRACSPYRVELVYFNAVSGSNCIILE
jgi:hypothetical protein